MTEKLGCYKIATMVSIISFFNTRIRQVLAFSLVALAGLVSVTTAPSACAMAEITQEMVNKALMYGMVQSELGYATLLGYNWQEGEEGMLLNVYTPFMQLAAKTYNHNYPLRPDEKAIAAAKKKNRRLVYYLLDPKGKQEVKFSLSFFGKTPDFATHTRAWIEGVGRGRSFTLKPYRDIRVKLPKQLEGSTPPEYEAMNAYYFLAKDMQDLDTFTFYVQQGEGEPAAFRFDNKKLL